MSNLQKIALQHDGSELIGEIATPAAPGPHPAVLVMHNAHGLSDHMRAKASALAELGYVAIATDMYGGGRYHADPSAAGVQLMQLVNAPQRLRARTVAWFEQLRARADVDAQRIAAIGYCFGGQCVLELARSGADVKAVVSYHGILSTSARAEPGAIRGQVAIYTGGRDPYAPAADVEALREELSVAGAPFQITVFDDAFHAFTDPHAGEMGRPGIAYHAIADRVSWAGTLALLQATIG